ncbi:hypothetical protein D3C81_1251640 [compost metagenome]
MSAGQAVAFADAVVQAQFQRRARVLENVLEQRVEPGGNGDQHQQAEEGALVPCPEAERNGQQQEGAVAEPGEAVGDMGKPRRAQREHPVEVVQQFVHDQSFVFIVFRKRGAPVLILQRQSARQRTKSGTARLWPIRHCQRAAIPAYPRTTVHAPPIQSRNHDSLRTLNAPDDASFIILLVPAKAHE